MNRRVGMVLLLLLLCALAACQRGKAAQTAQDFSGSLAVGGQTRSYLGHLPSGYDGTSAMPLLLALHGGGGQAKGMNGLTHLNQIADEHGFLVVYPDGYKLHWGDGRGVSP